MKSTNDFRTGTSASVETNRRNVLTLAPDQGPKFMEGDDSEVVNEEDQNQVVNAQPLEEFISNVVNKEEPENRALIQERIED